MARIVSGLALASTLGVTTAYTPDSGFFDFKLSGSSYTQDAWSSIKHCGLSSDTFTVKRYTVGTHPAGEECQSRFNLGILILEDQSGNNVRILSCDNQVITINQNTFRADENEYMVGQDIPHFDLGDISVTASAEECEEKCNANNDCWYWAWDSSGGGNCWLKHSRPDSPTANGDRVSGQKKCHRPAPVDPVSIGQRGGQCAGGYYTLPNELTQYVGLTTPDWGGNTPGWNFGTHAKWTKLKMDFNTFVVDASNSVEATKYASAQAKFASVGDCKTSGSATGKMTIDLRGTPFAIKDQQSCNNYVYAGHGDCGQWHGHGWSGRTKVTCSHNNQLCVVECGGYCGGCSLNGNELKLKVVDQSELDTQCPVRTAEPTTDVPTTAPTTEPTTAPTDVPTTAPTTAAAYAAQQMTEALGGHRWNTGQNGDNIYKCDQQMDKCYVNARADRGTWEMLDGPAQANMGVNLDFTTSDGTWTVDTEKITFDNGGGAVNSFPFSCSCK